MNEKMFNTRIIHKHDTEANWNKAVNFIPMQGEIIVYDIDENYNYERIKIGDGQTVVADLPFTVSAIAIDDVDFICQRYNGWNNENAEVFTDEDGAVLLFNNY